MLGLFILLSILLISLFGPLIYTVPPREMVWMPMTPPGRIRVHPRHRLSWPRPAGRADQRRASDDNRRACSCVFDCADRCDRWGACRVLWRLGR
ncbi:hypothetical protein N4R57_06970 [Rhodobacteraceae bacterium D3-12]|nr:hypothetical protein N4R57_06970 [Rhodobacteraceae bacterium D3-12]